MEKGNRRVSVRVMPREKNFKPLLALEIKETTANECQKPLEAAKSKEMGPTRPSFQKRKHLDLVLAQ